MLRVVLCLIAAACVGAFTAGPQLITGRQLAARRPAVLAAAPEPEEEDVPELLAPPSRPRACIRLLNFARRLALCPECRLMPRLSGEMMTESERRRAEPVHDLKQKRKARKIRDDEGDLVEPKK